MSTPKVTALPQTWDRQRLRDVATLSLGKMLDKKQHTGLHPTPYLRNINIRWHKVELEDLQEMDIAPGQLERVSLRPGDVAVCEGGEPGRAAIWSSDKPIAIQKALHRVRPHSELDPRFLVLLLEREFRGNSDHPLFTGTTIKHIPKEKLGSLEVPLPPPNEQERIVELLEGALSRLDAAQESVRTVRAKADQLRRSLLHAALTGRLSGLSSEPGEHPDGWDLHLLGDLATLSLGKMLDKKQHTGLHPTPYLRNINIRWHKVELEDLQSMDIAPEQLERVSLRAGDVAVCEGGEPGRAAIWDSDEPIAIQKALHRVRPADQLDSRYLALVLEREFRGAADHRLFTGTTIKHLPKEKIALVPVPLPPVEVQHRVVLAVEDHLSRLEAALAAADVIDRRSTAMRRSLLHAAFTGRLTEEWRENTHV